MACRNGFLKWNVEVKVESNVEMMCRSRNVNVEMICRSRIGM